LRVDANGAFSPAQAKGVLAQLAKLKVHSIEQPIAAGQTAAMAELCRNTPTPIALDEELIKHTHFDARNELVEQIKPQYLVLKPSLLGGFAACSEWISIAETNSLGWWITSALESNIGLNAIAQFTAQFLVNMPQGLGTGQLYTNNIESPLCINRGFLQYQPHLQWEEEL
jgi:L-alanine-DL-glutamate epimerase-like enolase superfamily enzyme